jgi:hypothetical protein
MCTTEALAAGTVILMVLFFFLYGHITDKIKDRRRIREKRKLAEKGRRRFGGKHVPVVYSSEECDDDDDDDDLDDEDDDCDEDDDDDNSSEDEDDMRSDLPPSELQAMEDAAAPFQQGPDVVHRIDQHNFQLPSERMPETKSFGEISASRSRFDSPVLNDVFNERVGDGDKVSTSSGYSDSYSDSSSSRSSYGDYGDSYSDYGDYGDYSDYGDSGGCGGD